MVVPNCTTPVNFQGQPLVRSLARCIWPGSDPLMIAYHDTEWGVPCHDDKKLFEYIVLDTFQAGLSWQVILRKRENFRRAFDNFSAAKIARYSDSKLAKLLANPGIIRNRLKIKAIVKNAIVFLKIQKEFGSFAKYLWSFVRNRPIIHRHHRHSQIAVSSRESDALSRDLKQRGFTFVGSTICHAFMQGAGLINDHLTTCFKWSEVSPLK